MQFAHPLPFLIAKRRCLTALAVVMALVLSAMLPLASSTAARQEENETHGLPLPSSEQLGGPHRPLLFLATDKPVYRPGETVYARAVLLQSDTFFPLHNLGNSIELTISGPRKEKVSTLRTVVNESTAGFTWAIPADTPGGLYEASVRMGDSPTAVRSFAVRAYATPRLKTQIAFVREGYGPGDTVSAAINVSRAEGGVPAKARITAIARVDGKEVARIPDLTPDTNGNCNASFALPAHMERGEGSLAFLIEDGGVVETASKTIPILLQTLDISFYPEGGELVAGLPGRVYVQALRPDGKPADITADILRVDAKDAPLPEEAVATLATLHEGRGIVSFTPEKDGRYALRLRQPSGINRLFPLPPVRTTGVALKALKEVYPFDQPITLHVESTPDSRADRITLLQRERLLDTAPLTGLQTGPQTDVTLNAGESEGVLMATVWDKDGNPLAERLIFRQPRFAVQMHLTAETVPPGGTPTPGGKIRLRVETTDSDGKPVEAVVGLTVTDDAVLEMVEKRDQAPTLPVMVYLENEVRDLADAHVYCDPANPDAGRDVDLLLGVQGWRRFILVRMDDLLKSDKDATRRALAIWPHSVMRTAAGPVLYADKMEDAGAVPQQMHRPALARMPDNAQPPAEVQAPPRQEPAPEMPDQEPAPKVRKRGQERVKPAPFGPGSLEIIREYAHTSRENRKPNERTDFTETIYWNAGLRTDPRNGKAEVTFDLSDSVTSFRIRADAFGNNGALGAGSAEVRSLEPFYLEPKLPPAVVSGDRPAVPVSLVNATNDKLDRINLLVRAEEMRALMSKLPAALSAGSRTRLLLGLSPDKVGVFSLTLNAAAGAYADSVTRAVQVLPRGFPLHQTAAGRIGPDRPFAHTVRIPKNLIPGSVTATVKVYPSPLANMEEALNALLRQPHGCFEQASSTSYPLVMAQQYFLSHAGVNPATLGKAAALLEESYKKLIGFECPAKGYEWFGGDPGHEALTAYGLMQFTEMSKVMTVDAAMLDRTRSWLLARRDGKGGFARNPKALDTFGAAPAPLTNLYILWTLLESGEKPESLRPEIDAARKTIAATRDPYLLALGANVLFLARDNGAAKRAATLLTDLQHKDGSLPGAETGITRSQGDALIIETTSLSILAWLRLGDAYAGSVEQAAGWLFERCKAGRFGSTQSTILALKAINAYDASRARLTAGGEIQLLLNGQPFGRPLVFDADATGVLELPDFSAALTPGEHHLDLRMRGGGVMPFAVEIICHTPQPDSSPESPLRLRTALSHATVKEGEPVDLLVRVSAGADNVHMPLAVVGLPAGLEPVHERLKELVAAGTVAAYEIRGRELTLYWRALASDQTLELTIPLLAAVPGSYTAPASRAYAYYLDEHKHWVAGEAITITPR